MADPKPRQPVLTVAMTAPQVIGSMMLLALLVALLTWWVVWWWIVSDGIILPRAEWGCSEAMQGRSAQQRSYTGPGWSIEWLTPEQRDRCVTMRRTAPK